MPKYIATLTTTQIDKIPSAVRYGLTRPSRLSSALLPLFLLPFPSSCSSHHPPCWCWMTLNTRHAQRPISTTGVNHSARYLLRWKARRSLIRWTGWNSRAHSWSHSMVTLEKLHVSLLLKFHSAQCGNSPLASILGQLIITIRQRIQLLPVGWHFGSCIPGPHLDSSGTSP